MPSDFLTRKMFNSDNFSIAFYKQVMRKSLSQRNHKWKSFYSRKFDIAIFACRINLKYAYSPVKWSVSVYTAQCTSCIHLFLFLNMLYPTVSRWIVRAMRGTIRSGEPSQRDALAIHQRFYTALALHDLAHEVPLSEVAAKYGATKVLDFHSQYAQQ